MKNILLAFLSLVILSQSKAFAGHDVANGGDAVVCYTDSTRTTITSVQLFDYWEQEQVLHYAGGVDLGGPTLSVQEKIELVTSRIQVWDPFLANKIKTVALALANNITRYTVTSYQLPEIDDANPKAIPNQPNCYIEQYAVRYKEVLSGQTRFAIADKFYNHANTSNNDKAGLLLHESMYAYAISNGAKNSDGVRLYNYAMSTSRTSGSISNYNLLLVESAIFGKLLEKETINFSTAPAVKIYTRDNIAISNQIVELSPTFKIDLKAGSWVGNGMPTFGEPYGAGIKISLFKNGVWADFYAGNITVFSDGRKIKLGLIRTMPNNFLSFNYGVINVALVPDLEIYYDLLTNDIVEIKNSSYVQEDAPPVTFPVNINGTVCQAESLNKENLAAGLEAILSNCSLELAGQGISTVVRSERGYTIYDFYGTSPSSYASRSVYLNTNGQITKTDYVDIPDIIIDGVISVKVLRFDFSKPNKFLGQGFATYTAYPTIKLFHSGRNAGGISVDTGVCPGKNPSFDIGIRVESTNTKFVSSSEYFMDLADAQMVTKADEIVEYVETFTCRGYFNFNL